jgi:acetyl esterase/lipase
MFLNCRLFTQLYYVILQSPWVDLTVSTPSVLDDECFDYIPDMKRGTANFVESQASKEYKEKDAALAAKIKEQNLGPKIWHDSFDRPDGRLQLYVANEGLAIPYVSPMLAESLCDLPPLLLVIKSIL